MKKILIILFSCLFIIGCGSKNDKNNYKEIMKEKEYIIVDVRTSDEYLESHIKGAINIPYDEIDKNVSLDKDKNIFVYCRSGARSKQAYDTLIKLGYTVYDLGALSNIDLEKEGNI